MDDNGLSVYIQAYYVQISRMYNVFAILMYISDDLLKILSIVLMRGYRNKCKHSETKLENI